MMKRNSSIFVEVVNKCLQTSLYDPQNHPIFILCLSLIYYVSALKICD